MFKWFQVLLVNTNDSIQHYSFVCMQLNGSMYCYVIVGHQFWGMWSHPFIAITLRFTYPSYEKIVGQIELFSLDMATYLGEGKLWISNQLYST